MSNEKQLTAIELIAAERQRQIEKEGWTTEHDDEHDMDQMARAAACYATPEWKRNDHPYEPSPIGWPWPSVWWKPTPDDRVRELVKAGALIVAEIERLQRKEQRRNLYVNGFHDGQSSPEMLIDDEVVQKYNEKYGSDETQI